LDSRACAEAQQVLEEAGVPDGQIFLAEHHAGGPLSSMVRQAWDVDAVEDSYERFLAEFGGARSGDPLTRTVQLVHAWRRFPRTEQGQGVAGFEVEVDAVEDLALPVTGVQVTDSQ
jgi:DNA-binding transcriptional regulator PaaX